MTLTMRLATALFVLIQMVRSDTANAADIKVLTVHGMASVLNELAPRFEGPSGHKLVMSFLTSGELLKRIDGGDVADIVIMPRQGISQLLKDGKVSSDSVTVVARSIMGVAVRKGSPKPDISSVDAFRKALLAAKTITYPNPAHGAVSGIHFAKVLDELGIASDVRPKTIFLPKAGPVGVLVAAGDAEIAIHQIQELLPVAGIEIVGPLPQSLQENLVFATAIMTGSKNQSGTNEFIKFLRAPEAMKTIKAKGMEPG